MNNELQIYPLVLQNSARATERRKRKNQFKNETISKTLVDEYVADGWTVERELLRTTRMKKPKEHDEVFENRVWLLFDQLGFSELNSGRQFKIRFSRSSDTDGSKQIDVFAKDDETVVVVECKSAKVLRKKSLQKDIEEFANLKRKIANSIREHYGKEFKPKIIWMMATSNIVWSAPDKSRAQGESIQIVTEKELRYFLELASHLGPAGKHQFLGHFLAGSKIPEMSDVRVPAIRGKLGGHSFYSFVATPDQLLKISFVNHRTLNDPKGAPSYQRLISKSRMKNIQRFINNGGFFPTNIILNFTKKPRFEVREKNGETDVHFGNLYLPNTYKSAWVIDGQHRLYSFAGLDDFSSSENLFVLAFEKMSKESEANLFVEINHEQKSVPKNLLDDLKGELHWGSEDPKPRISAMCSRLVNLLNDDLGEPFFERVVQTGLRANKDNLNTCLTLPQIKEGLERSKLLGFVHPKLKSYTPGPFSGLDDFATVDRARSVLNGIFGRLRNAGPTSWDAGPDVGFCRNISIQAITLMVAECLRVYQLDTTNDPIELSTNELIEAATSYLEPLIDLLEQKDLSEVRSLFRDGVPPGSSGQRELFLKLVDLCRSKTPHLGPEDFDAWKIAQDKERAASVKQKIGELNSEICRVLFEILKKHYASKDYFEKAVKNKDVILSATRKSLDEDTENRGPLEEYLELIEYKKIAEKMDHWQLVKDVFDIPLPGEKGLAKNLKWLEKLNDIRKRAFHETKGRPLDIEQMMFVEWIHELFINKVSAFDRSVSTNGDFQ